MLASLQFAVPLILVIGTLVSCMFAFQAIEKSKLADIKTKEAIEQRDRAETSIAEALLDQGLGYCENQDVTRGLLTLVRALENAPASATEVKEAIRLNIAFWQGQLTVLKEGGWRGSSMTAVAYAPDGKTWVTGDRGNHKNVAGPPHLIVNDAHIGSKVGDIIKDHTLAIWRVAYSPDGTRFASASFDGTARLWDAATHQPIGQPMSHDGRRVFSLAFSPDGKRLVTGSHRAKETSSILQVWNAESVIVAGEPVIQPGLVRTVAWSGDGKLWASGSTEYDVQTKQARGGAARFWDAQTHMAHGEPLLQLDPVGAVAFQPEVGWLASGTEDGVVRFLDPATGQRTGKLLQHRDPVNSLVFSRDGLLLLVGSGENRPGRDKGGRGAALECSNRKARRAVTDSFLQGQRRRP